MKTTLSLLLASVVAGCISALAQGAVVFGNRNPLSMPPIDARFGYPICLGGGGGGGFPPTEWVYLSGADGWVAQLYVALKDAGGTSGSLSPVGSIVPFRDGLAAGYIRSTVVTTAYPGGTTVWAEMRAWNLRDGATYEEASWRYPPFSTACVFTAGPVAVTLATPTAPPADLIGLETWILLVWCYNCLSLPRLTYETWAAGQGLPANASGPTDDPDRDGLPNFAEYACATNPLQPDSELAVPKAGIVRLDGHDYLTITFRRQRIAPEDVQYRVTASDLLVPWAGASTVTALAALVDRGTYAEATFRSTRPIPITSATTGFLRLEIAR